MMINMKESTLIRPDRETPKHCIRTTVMDKLMSKLVNPYVYFYKRPENTDSSSFFEATAMKEALAKVLVPFYPFAGRLVKDSEGGFDIHCNAEGVLFTEAETRSVMDDFVRSESNLKLQQLLPALLHSEEESLTHPLFRVQVTRFSCGGVCIGVVSHHLLADGGTAFLFNMSWAETARGSPTSCIPPTVLDRTILDVGVPISPTFDHVEYVPLSSTINGRTLTDPNPETTATIEVSLEQTKILREIYSKRGDGSVSTVRYSRYEILAAHIWRCMCKARALPADRLSKLGVAIDGRSKMNPQIPPGYIGNVVFTGTSIATPEEIQSEPSNQTVERIRESIERMDDKYLKSALSYLKQLPDSTLAERAEQYSRRPNLNISNLSSVPFYGTDFGWGRPICFKPVNSLLGGQVFILPSPRNDGGLIVSVHLETYHHSQTFRKFFYEIFSESQDGVRSRY